MIDPVATPVSENAEAQGPGPWLPGDSGVTFHDVLHALNPLQHLPGVGMIYRATTGDEIPHPLRILGAGILGGPAGMLGSALFGLVSELARLGPDHSRPPVPAGFAMAGAEAGPEPVTPGTLAKGEYTTLATAEPEFLRASEQALLAGMRPAAAYAAAANTYQFAVPGQGMA